MKIEENIKFDITDLLYYKKYEEGKLIEEGMNRGNTIFTRGKQELAKLIGGLDSKYIDKIWIGSGGVIYNSDVTATKPLGIDSATLLIQANTTFTTAGTYSWIGCGNSSFGSVDMYSSLATTIVLFANQELVLGVKWIFDDGKEDVAIYGEAICASRLGNIADSRDAPIDHIITWMTGDADPQGIYHVTNSVTENTLDVMNQIGEYITAPETLDRIGFWGESAAVYFDVIRGFTLSITEGSIYLKGKFIFG